LTNLSSISPPSPAPWEYPSIVAVAGKDPVWLRNLLGVAVAGQTHERYRHLLDSPRGTAPSVG
jgi:hypothetical protein